MEDNNIKKAKLNTLLIVTSVVVILLVVGLLCFKYFFGDDNNGDMNKGDESVSLVTDTKGLVLDNAVSDYLFNGNCDKETIKTKFSIQMSEGKALVTNQDTMENFTIDKFANAKLLTQFSYEGQCDKKIYLVITNDGKIYYTNNAITTISDVKNIENYFYLLKTDLRFESASVVKVKDEIRLYGKTSTNNVYLIDLR